MKLEVLNVTVVVAATDHNPSILHPSFLKAEGIIGSDWELAAPPICTPPLSIVKFQNGVEFLVEPQKFLVGDNQPGADPGSSMVSGLADKYVKTLPHVRYTGVGINMRGFVEIANPDAQLMERFLKRGSWNERPLLAEAVGLRFTYRVDGSRLLLTVNGGTNTRRGELQRHGIVLDANYHLEIDPQDSKAKVHEAIASFSHFCSDFATTTRRVLRLDKSHDATTQTINS